MPTTPWEISFRAVMASASAITSLLATPASIYPVNIPTDAPLPAIDYRVVAGPVTPTFSTRGFLKARVEVNCWGSTYDDAVALRAAVVDTLHGYSDANLDILYLQPQDFFDHDLLQYRAMAEFYVFVGL